MDEDIKDIYICVLKFDFKPNNAINGVPHFVYSVNNNTSRGFQLDHIRFICESKNIRIINE